MRPWRAVLGLEYIVEGLNSDQRAVALGMAEARYRALARDHGRGDISNETQNSMEASTRSLVELHHALQLARAELRK